MMNLEMSERASRNIQILVRTMLDEVEKIESGHVPSKELWNARTKLLRISHELRPSEREWLVILLLAYEVLFVSPFNLKSVIPIKKLLMDLLLGGEKTYVLK